MNTILNFSKHFATVGLVFSTLSLNAQAQKPVESTHVDEKFAYTTVVYKNTAASDKDVLASLENDFGIGDVVRVTLAPPPSASAPLSAVSASEPVYADKSKGEDVWLDPKGQSIDNLNAAKPKPIIVAKPIAVEQPKVVKTVEPAAAPVKPLEAAPVAPAHKSKVKANDSGQGKSIKARKSSKKSGKKSAGKLKWKPRKHGKQRYSCPSF